MTPPTQTAFNELKQKVFTYWPTAKQLPENKDILTPYDFSKSFISKNENPIAQERQQEFIVIVQQEIEKLLGEDVAQSVATQLKSNHSFSTAQHFSSITHTRTLNSSIQIALPYFEQNSDEYQNILVLSCANISFDNPWFPRGVLFHSLANNELIENQLPFFSRKVRPLPIRNHPGYDQLAIDETLKKLNTMKNEKTVSSDVFEKMETIIKTVYAHDTVLSRSLFSEQATITNFKIWQEIFKATAQDLHIPNLVFMEQENIVLKLLVKHHINEQTIIHELLFNPKCYPLIEEYFDGIQGGFSLKKGSGSFLFWALPKDQKYRLQLFRQGNTLVSPDGSYSVDLTPETIIQKIEERELIPSSLLSLLILSMYYGFILTGGMDQPTYLPQLRNAYIKICKDLEDTESIDVCKDIPVKNYTITRPTLAYIAGPNDTRDPLTGLDPIIHGKPGSFNAVLEASKQVTIDNLIDRVLPNVYGEYVPTEQKTEQASAVTERGIEKLTGLDKKIPPLVTIE